MIRVYSTKRKRRNPSVIYIDLGVHYLWGKEAEYMKAGSFARKMTRSCMTSTNRPPIYSLDM